MSIFPSLVATILQVATPFSGQFGPTWPQNPTWPWIQGQARNPVGPPDGGRMGLRVVVGWEVILKDIEINRNRLLQISSISPTQHFWHCYFCRFEAEILGEQEEAGALPPGPPSRSHHPRMIIGASTYTNVQAKLAAAAGHPEAVQNRTFAGEQVPVSIWSSFPGMGIPMLKIKRSRDRLIFNMGIPILVRRHLYIETGPWIWSDDHDHWSGLDIWGEWSLLLSSTHTWEISGEWCSVHMGENF